MKVKIIILLLNLNVCGAEYIGLNCENKDANLVYNGCSITKEVFTNFYITTGLSIGFFEMKYFQSAIFKVVRVRFDNFGCWLSLLPKEYPFTKNEEIRVDFPWNLWVLSTHSTHTNKGPVSKKHLRQTKFYFSYYLLHKF